MLTSAGVRASRGFVRCSYGFLQRKRPVFCKIDKVVLRQTSSLGHNLSNALFKGLCTTIQVRSTRRLCVGNDTEDAESERRVETQERTPLEVPIYEKNDGEGNQNGQEKCLNSGEKDSHLSSSNMYNCKTSSAVDTDSKRNSNPPQNTGINVRESYPIADSPRFQLPADWKQNRDKSPGIKFPGDIYVIKSSKDEIEHKEILEQFLDEDVLGFDTEHCPVEHQVCVVQLATQETAVLWQCMNFKRKIPSYLKEILTGRVAKVGHACVDDAIMISNQFNIEPVNLIDTYCWARDLYCSHKSLQGVCAIFLNEFLSKKHQRSDWKKANLSPGQVRYAATDAWISLRVYEEMKRHGEELGVTLTPIYKNLQQWQAEVKDNQRRRRKRRRERIREQKQELLSQIESVKQNGHSMSKNSKSTTDHTVLPERLNTGEIVESATEPEIDGKANIINNIESDDTSHTTDDINSGQDNRITDDILDSSEKQSKGSRRRTRKFLAKFHPLE